MKWRKNFQIHIVGLKNIKITMETTLLVLVFCLEDLEQHYGNTALKEKIYSSKNYLESTIGLQHLHKKNLCHILEILYSSIHTQWIEIVYSHPNRLSVPIMSGA